MRSRRLLAAAIASLAVLACSRRPTSDTTADTPPVTATNADTAPLRATYWKLTALGTSPVNVPDSDREPHIVLQADSARVFGSGGCNRLTGAYESTGDALTFSRVASTKMFCQGAMDVETAFLPALERVARYRITGQQLELLDSSGAVVAKFDAKRK